MKRILAALLVFVSLCSGYAREPQRGYRGFFEWDNSLGSMPYFDHSVGEDKNDFQWIFGCSTAHGYQINKMYLSGQVFCLLLVRLRLNVLCPYSLIFVMTTVSVNSDLLEI